MQPGLAGFVIDVQMSTGSGRACMWTLTILVIAGATRHDETVIEHAGKTVGPLVDGTTAMASFAAPGRGHGYAPGGCQIEGWSP